MISNAIRRGDRLIPAHAGKTRRSTPLPTARTAHPRSRGENNRIACGLLTICGSSPLTRGKLPDSEGWTPIIRLIPAHAGKTFSRRSAAMSRRAHPRSRGENAGGRVSRVGARGSSPLTRGKRLLTWATWRSQGLIPAHAGKTDFCEVADEDVWAHPRSRGENGALFAGAPTVLGSSPLTRGKPITRAARYST